MTEQIENAVARFIIFTLQQQLAEERKARKRAEGALERSKKAQQKAKYIAVHTVREQNQEHHLLRAARTRVGELEALLAKHVPQSRMLRALP